VRFCVELPGLVQGQIKYLFHQCLVHLQCATRYRTRHFFNNSKTNEDVAKKFEQEYVRCVRNEKEFVCSVCKSKFRCNILISGKIIKEMPDSVASGAPYRTGQAADDMVVRCMRIARCILKATNTHIYTHTHTHNM